ncbi:hypothetical protein RQP46_001567 [Phenoliferia psychrophenolica]
MQAYHRQLVAPTGVSHALSLRLTTHQQEGVISQLITARDSFIQVWNIIEHGETATLQHVYSRRLHGSISSLSRVRTLASKHDGADRVLISFLDAKMALMEWTPAVHELLPISLHTFEKLPQVVDGLARTATDPASRLSVLLLPSNTGGDGTLAVLPFFQEELDLESLGVDAAAWGADGIPSLPYAPSHLLPLASLTAPSASFAGPSRSSTLGNAPPPPSSSAPPVRNVIDMVFLPGFNEPTLALLYAPEPTWTGRLENMSSNCLVSLVTLASTSNNNNLKGGGEGNTTTAVVISTSPSLPHSSLSIHPCPPDLGGTLVLTANGIIHVEQSGKLLGVPTNAWFPKEYFGPGKDSPGKEMREPLEGARVVFVSNTTAIVFAKSGNVLELKLEVVAQVAVDEGMDIDDDDEDDIYGDSSKVATAVVPEPVLESTGPSAEVDQKPARSLTLRTCDTIASYGGIRSVTMGLVEDESPPELVACTGGGTTAGFTVFPRSISPRKRRKLDLGEHATRGVWSLSVGTEHQSVLITSTPTGTKMSHGTTGAMSPDHETPDATLAAGTVFGSSALVRVTADSVVLLNPDLSVAQTILLANPGAKRATVLDEYVLVTGSTPEHAQLFFANVSSRELENVPLPPALLTESLSISLFTDLHRVVPLVRPVPQDAVPTGTSSTAMDQDGEGGEGSDDEDDLYATAPKRPHASQSTQKEAELVIPSDSPRSWLPVVDASGTLKIYALPSMDEVFSSGAIALLPMVITDNVERAIPANVDPDDVEIERVAFFNLGESRLRPHLVILLSNGSFAAYEGFPSVLSARPSTRPSGSLGVRFVKVLVKRLPAPRTKRTPGDTLEAPRRDLVPFHDVQGFSGAFVLGEDPFWLVAADHGQAHLYEHGEKGVYGFSPCRFEEEGGYVVQSREGASVATLAPGVCFDREMPYVRVPRDRRYAAFTFDLDSGLYVCGALFDTVFMNFDDEGKPVFVNDSPDLIEPTNYRSAVELISPGTWSAIDGYEFRPNEFISVVKSVSLATRSTVSGRKDFIAVGTTVYRAEDLAARGGLYLFEVIKVVAHPDTPTHDHKLKLLTFEDTKSVVGNLCDIDGYLVMSMGQKLYVRAFEQDEVLIAVGFLDVGVHVTSLQAMKNFLLIGDALQSVTLVAFQEDPYKLIFLGRDYRPSRTTSANFLVNDGRVAFVVGDIEGVLRVFEYDPTNIASQAGQRLLCRTEYHAGAEAVATMLYAKRSGADEAKQNGILYGGIDGSLYTLVPVREAVFKRLLSLQTHLARHIQHFGGLNPRGFRMVKNDSVSRAITKGVLDGELLAEFEWLPLDLQMLLTDLIKSDPDTISANLRNLSQSF